MKHILFELEGCPFPTLNDEEHIKFCLFHAAERVFEEKTGRTLLCHKEATPFAFAGPDVFKYDTSIDTLTAYKRYISSKPWAASNYLRDPSKKPNWL